MGNPAWRSALAGALLRLANERGGNGDQAGQIRDLTEAVRIYRRLINDPDTAKFQKTGFASGPDLIALTQANFAHAVFMLIEVTNNDRRYVSAALIQQSLDFLDQASQSGRETEYVVATRDRLYLPLSNALAQKP